MGDNTVNTVYTILPWKPLKVIGIAYLQAWNDFIINGFDFIRLIILGVYKIQFIGVTMKVATVLPIPYACNKKYYYM